MKACKEHDDSIVVYDCYDCPFCEVEHKLQRVVNDADDSSTDLDAAGDEISELKSQIKDLEKLLDKINDSN